MSAKRPHTILGFYSANDGDPKQAFEAARRAGASGYLIDGADGSESKYSGLRLEGETVVVASAGATNLEEIAKALESSGSPAIFILRDDSKSWRATPHQESILAA